jgi:hypothetical protein
MKVPNLVAPMATAGLLGCARPAVGPPGPRPVEEHRAIVVIGQAYQKEGQTAESGRVMQLASGRTLKVDVGTAGRKYGVAYLTSADVAGLDPSRDLPPPMPANDLPLVQGTGADADAVILVLLSTNYLDAAGVGSQGAPASASAEQRIAQDVRDFLVQARARHLP